MRRNGKSRILFGSRVAAAIVFSLSASLSTSIVAERFDYHSIRRPAKLVPHDGMYEGERFFVRHGLARPQPMQGFGAGWSGNSQFLWDGPIGEEARLKFSVDRESRYQLSIRLTKAPDYGVYQVVLDGVEVGEEIDLFSGKVELAQIIDLGEVALAEGKHSLVLRLTRANENARPIRGKNYVLGVDYFRLVDLAPPRKEEPPPSQEVAAAEIAEPEVVGEPVATIDFDTAHQFTEKYCVDCHSGDEPKGDVSLGKIKSRQDLLDDPDLADQIADVLTFGTMPPENKPQPSKLERSNLATFLSGVLDEYADGSGELKPAVMRRLTRYEYNNAVRDLLDLRGDIYPLPERALRADHDYFDPANGALPETVRVGNRTLGKNVIEKQILDGVSPFAIDLQAEHGFNNRGEELSFSPLLLETFVALGKSVVNSSQFPGYCRSYNKLFLGSDPPEREHDLRLAETRILDLLKRAFRQPADEATGNRYVEFFGKEYERTRSFAESMKSTVAGILASPRFLYLVKSRPETAASTPLSDYELATKLSFFLWSTVPDEKLLDAAEQGRLSQPEELDRQVSRMLLDKRCHALAENFARQWLRLDRLITAVPDFERFNRYYSRIGCEQWKFGLQTMNEPLLLFESILVEDRSIMLLIDSNYTYRSDELQSWYQDEKPFGDKGNVGRFETNMQNYSRRELTSRREGGVITTAATMTMTSSPLRTSPIIRGSWVATVILNQPPKPPPDVVPEIEADDAAIEAKGITLRERLKQHQENESCVACHAKIDPYGFVLENYDAVGRWRDTYRSGLAIDASGKLLGDAEFKDIESFKDLLLERPTIFMRGFTEHLLSYALGRKLGPSDKPTVDRIVRRVEADHGRFSTVVREIVRSRAFRRKANQ